MTYIKHLSGHRLRAAAVAVALLALSGCVVESAGGYYAPGYAYAPAPAYYGYGGYYRGGGGHHRDHDWR